MQLNRARNDPIWKQIRTAAVSVLGEDVEIIFPEIWSERYLSWYKEIERSSFRPSLTYSIEEIEERLQKEAVLLMFIVNGDVPEGLIFGYRLEESSDDIFYLDTVAVKQKGRGLGKVIFNTIISWAKKMGFSSIQMDTEHENEIGFQLVKFYQNLGFQIIYSDEETGNITMQIKL